MTEHERREAAIGKMHRMIVYVRDEAARLRMMDVVLLLDRAEEAVTVFGPTASNRPSPSSSLSNLDANRVEH